MSSPNKEQPIIIKKITIGHAGHHGGAWKVAYADFVTAMMAFFLLMWLLNSIPSEKLRGIAQYFEPTIGLSGQQGIGFAGGLKSSPTKEGTRSESLSQGIKYGVISKGNIIENTTEGAEVSQDERDNKRFSLIQNDLQKAFDKDGTLGEFADSVSYEITPEGLNITISDQDKYPMFKPGSAELNVITKNILYKISQLLKFSPNFIGITGHTDKAISVTNLEYTNWELSADRANSARKYLIETGMPQDKVAKVVAKADTDPVDKENPYAAKNRRITIIILRNSVMPYEKLSVPQNVMAP